MVELRKFAAILVVIFSVLSLSTLTACDGFFVSENAIDHVSLSATAVVLSSNAGGTAQSVMLSATAVAVSGNSTDVTSTAAWASSNSSIATVDATGKVTAVSAGTVTISATSGGAAGKATVIVVAGSITTFAVTPGSVSLHTSTGPFTQQLTATLTTGTGSLDLTQIASWASDTTSVATVDANGLVRGIISTTNILGTANTAKVTATIQLADGTTTATSNISVDPL